jgi:hypothetical protein
MIWFGAIGVAALLVAGAIAWQHNPTRKWIQRHLDPAWTQSAKPGAYPADVIAAEARNMYVSSTVMRDACDVIWDEFDPEPPENLIGPHPHGTVIWVNTCHVARFLASYLPKIDSPFVLVTGRENITTSTFDLASALAHPTLLHWFMENYEHPEEVLQTGRITPLPLGLNYHKLDPDSPNQSRDMGLPAPPAVQQLDMNRIKATLPPLRDRPLKLYCNFHLNMDTFLRHPNAQKRATARADALAKLSGKPFVLWEKRQAPRPRGLGATCGRFIRGLAARQFHRLPPNLGGPDPWHHPDRTDLRDGSALSRVARGDCARLVGDHGGAIGRLERRVPAVV